MIDYLSRYSMSPTEPEIIVASTFGPIYKSGRCFHNRDVVRHGHENIDLSAKAFIVGHRIKRKNRNDILKSVGG